MQRIANASSPERSELFRTTAFDLGLSEALVEKDFWVSYMLDVLFQRSSFRDSIVFKGGTSLSKGFNLIHRFSEDIDLILDWRLIGYEKDEPWEPKSNNKLEKFKKEANEKTNAFLSDTFIPEIKGIVSADLGIDAKISAAAEDETVIFAYPRIYDSNALLDTIRLEIGPLAAWSPSEVIKISSYCAQSNPGILNTESTNVKTVNPERTFWEKATILHQEANRPESKLMPKRYSRHYYDLHQLANSPVLKTALSNPELLDKVVEFKERFYRTPWSKLPDAKMGTIKLVPPDFRTQELSQDYENMSPMIYGERPLFEELLESMRNIEETINKG